MSELMPGADWTYHAQITNGAGGAGTVSAEVVAGAGSEFRFLYGMIENGDSTSRVARASIEDDGNNRQTVIASETLGAGGIMMVPTNDEDPTQDLAGGTPEVISGTMVLRFEVESTAASQDATFGITCRIRGAVPVATEVGNSTPTITINTERVF